MTDNITINIQSSIRLDAGKQVLYFDPIEIGEATHDADIIFLTHSHSDHFDPESINKLSKGPDETFIVCPFEMRDEVQQKTNVEHNDIVPLRPGSEFTLNGFPIEAIRAYNIGKDFHPKDNNWLGYVVTVNGTRYYISGDMDATEEARAVRCDVALVPIGGKYTMDKDEAAAFVNGLKPKVVIPTHYGSIIGEKTDGDDFAKKIDPSIQVVLKLWK